MIVPRVVIPVVAVTATLGMAAPATAAVTVGVQSGQVLVTGSTGIDDVVLSIGNDGRLTVDDATGATPLTGCEAVQPVLRCDLTGVTGITVNLGAGADVLDASAPPGTGQAPPKLTVNAGDGDDQVTGGVGIDDIDGESGADV